MVEDGGDDLVGAELFVNHARGDGGFSTLEAAAKRLAPALSVVAENEELSNNDTAAGIQCQIAARGARS